MHLDLLAALFAAALPLLAPAPHGSKPINPNAGATTFTFVVTGDNRPRSASCPQPPQLAAIVADIAKLKPAFALWNGDVIYGKDTSTAAGQYPAFLTVISAAGVPIFVAPGNHELSVKGKCPDPSDPTGKKLKVDEPDPTGILANAFVNAVGAPYGYFRYGNSAFIEVNTDDTLDAGYPSNWCIYNGFVGTAQLKALKTTLDALQADKTVAHIFIFMHRPIHGEQAQDDLGPSSIPQIATFDSYLQSPSYTKLSVVFSSHEHLFYIYDPTGKMPAGGPYTRTDPSKKGPTFVVTGGAGAPLSKSGTGAFNHYLQVTVNGNLVTVTVVQLPPMPNNCPS